MNIGELHEWLGELIAGSSEIKACEIFRGDGCGLLPTDFHWGDSEGRQSEPGDATEVTVGGTETREV